MVRRAHAKPERGAQQQGVLPDGKPGADASSVDSLAQELPSVEVIRELVSRRPASFVRDMAYSLLVSAVRAHDTGDLESLGQSVVNWASTLEVEGDATLRRRLRRRAKRAESSDG